MPEQTRVVVANTTPIIGLTLIGQLELLRKLYGRVQILPAVQNEVLAGGASGIGIAEFKNAVWLQVTPLIDPSRADLLSDLDRGEAEAIALAQELHANLVIIDERMARKHARRLGLKLTGTLGVLLEAKNRGHIRAVKPLIQQLVQGGIRLGDQLIAETLKLAKEN
jgi:predicted nucleic acid-binding protein